MILSVLLIVLRLYKLIIMTQLEIKSIKHCEKQLNDIDPHEVYLKVNEALISAGCSPLQTNIVLGFLSGAQSKTNHRIREVKEWLTELLKS